MGEESKTAKIKMDVREDGIYIIIDNPPEGNRAARKDILKIIEDCGLTEIDFSAINEIFKSSDQHIEKKLTNNTTIRQKDERVTIEVSKDKMQAFIKFSEPGYNGVRLSLEQIKKNIDDAGVRFGIDEGILKELEVSRKFEQKYLIAVGLPAMEGKDGYLDYKFNTNAKDNKPKILPDGRVDFHQIDFFEPVVKNQLLVQAIPPVDGRDGTNVLGQVISHRPGKPAPKITGGKHMEVSEDGSRLTSLINGQLLFQDKKITVSPVLVISDSVDNTTGNIDFDGSVLVNGMVRSGFEVKATGNIEVKGMVEGAYIESGADIHLYSGIQGLGKAVIKADGNIFTKFAQQATLSCGGDITSDNLMHCNINCGGSIKLDGRNCLLVGGTIVAGNKITAKTIGSSMATTTDISVGNAPQELQKYNELKAQLNKATTDYNKVSVSADSILKAIGNNINQLPEEKKAMLLKTMHTKAYLRDRMLELQKQVSETMTKLNLHQGSVSASGVIHSGIKVMIGDALMYVRDDIPSCTLRNVDGKIHIGPF